MLVVNEPALPWVVAWWERTAKARRWGIDRRVGALARIGAYEVDAGAGADYHSSWGIEVAAGDEETDIDWVTKAVSDIHAWETKEEKLRPWPVSWETEGYAAFRFHVPTWPLLLRRAVALPQVWHYDVEMPAELQQSPHNRYHRHYWQYRRQSPSFCVACKG